MPKYTRQEWVYFLRQWPHSLSNDPMRTAIEFNIALFDKVDEEDSIKKLINKISKENRYIDRNVLKAFFHVIFGSLKEVPLYINEKDERIKAAVKWRFRLGR